MSHLLNLKYVFSLAILAFFCCGLGMIGQALHERKKSGSIGKDFWIGIGLATFGIILWFVADHLGYKDL
jgi:hypothetical protein